MDDDLPFELELANPESNLEFIPAEVAMDSWDSLLSVQPRTVSQHLYDSDTAPLDPT